MMLWPVSAVKVDYTSRNTASRSLRVDMNVIQTEARQALNKHVFIPAAQQADVKKTLELLQPMPPSWETLCYKKQHNKDFQGLSACKWRTFYVSSGEIYTLQTCFFFLLLERKSKLSDLGFTAVYWTNRRGHCWMCFQSDGPGAWLQMLLSKLTNFTYFLKMYIFFLSALTVELYVNH